MIFESKKRNEERLLERMRFKELQEKKLAQNQERNKQLKEQSLKRKLDVYMSLDVSKK